MPKATREVDRLTAVRSLRSTQRGATEEMQALATLACGVFNTDFAAINIVEEDWLRVAGQAGLLVAGQRRDQSICTRVVDSNHPVVVADLQADAKFRDISYVCGEPHFRFYAGVPIEVEPGLPVGAFCLLDREPRQLSAFQLEMLQHFATVASALLRLQKSNIIMSLAERELRNAAMTDPLTGFFNRSALPALIDNALADALQRGRHFGAIYMDLDGFKAINDRLGHQAGDEILRMAAERVRAAVRQTDLVVRMGGDEFAIFAPDACDRQSMEALAGRLVLAFREPFPLEGKVADVRVSVGAAIAPDAGDSGIALRRKVDEALYRAKSAGRDQFALDWR